ncbi:beta-ketoacyl-[acyl-carrier-protein] synthase family protein [Alicyclobacillus sp. ALC3]|uniref:beta-ketoacyl-[acyl-carrier-protein] synthase family protein n=1 Tax=Alicyclobacillus sp. ALC3 TaxID=2796143 RepID=UPI0023799B9D|nr:beta-ketoacyl-[acyl-carrier-protein] synthase family protein [Alicyclobacillus sp. ALC3]
MTTQLMRIAVTGRGAVTPHGVGVAAFWDALVQSRSAVRPTDDPAIAPYAPVVAAVPNFEPRDFLTAKLVKDSARFTQTALVSAGEALVDAGFAKTDSPLEWKPGTDSDRIGVFMGTTFGSVRSFDDAAASLLTERTNRAEPRLVSKSIPNGAAAALAIQYGVQGPVLTYSTACASSANSLGEALMWLRSGQIDVALAGGTDCLFAPTLLAGLRASGALAVHGPDDLSAWSRPFDQDRAGMVMGEGAAVLVLEPYERAVARGAKIYAEFVGYGTTNDAFHQIAPHPKGEGAALAMRKALRSAGLQPEQIGYINAHATSTKAGDDAEIHALNSVFGDALQDIPVSSIKGSIGHSLGAAGAVESLACVESLHRGVLPPNLHCDNPEPDAPALLLRDGPVERRVTYALSNSFGFGGQNGVVIWKAAE